MTKGYSRLHATTATLATDGADPGSISLSDLDSAKNYLIISALSGEGPNTDAYTADADYTMLGNDGSGAASGTTGGSTATNQHARLAYRLNFTGSTTDTVNHTSLTADRDYAQALIAFYEAAAATKSPPPNLFRRQHRFGSARRYSA